MFEAWRMPKSINYCAAFPWIRPKSMFRELESSRILCAGPFVFPADFCRKGRRFPQNYHEGGLSFFNRMIKFRYSQKKSAGICVFFLRESAGMALQGCVKKIGKTQVF
jgi:hypothetical protein